MHSKQMWLTATRCYVVCLYVTWMYPAKMTEPIKMPFGMWARSGRHNHVLDKGPDPPGEGATVEWERSPAHSKVLGTWSICSGKTDGMIQMAFACGLAGSQGTMLDGGPDPPHRYGHFWGGFPDHWIALQMVAWQQGLLPFARWCCGAMVSVSNYEAIGHWFGSPRGNGNLLAYMGMPTVGIFNKTMQPLWNFFDLLLQL